MQAKLREGRAEAVGPDDVWALDVVHDQLARGRKMRVLTVVDAFSRDAPAFDARFSYDDVLQGTIWHDINAARITDSWLMLIGGFNFPPLDEDARNGFINALPGDSGEVLEALAERIATALLSTRFIQSFGA